MNLNLKPPSHWDEAEKAYLRRHYGKLTNEAIAEHLRRPAGSIPAQARRMHITKAGAATLQNDPQAQHIHRARKVAPTAGLHDVRATATRYGQPPTPLTGTAPQRSMRNGSYPCPELRPYQGRPGAMDAFRLPSRAGARRTFRDGRVEVAA